MDTENKQNSIISMEHIYKSFGDVRALDDVSLTLNSGEIRALVGENGAGKSTLMNILYGMYSEDKGTIRINGETLTAKWSPGNAIEHGIGMIHQHFTLVSSMTVLENIVMPTLKWNDFDPQWKKAKERVLALSAEYDFNVDPSARVCDLTIGERQQVEILKALYHDAHTLILDEPTGVLTPQQTKNLFRFMSDLRERGFSVVFITHKLKEVMEISNTVSVLRGGILIDTLKTEDADVHIIAKMMVNRSVNTSFRKCEVPQTSKSILEMNNVTVRDAHKKNVLSDVSLTVRENEIVGIAGAAGSGQHELARTIVGLLKANEGEILLNGERINDESIGKRIDKGIGYIPEDRHSYAMIQEMSLQENLILSRADSPAYSKRGVLKYREIEETGKKAIDEFFIRARNEKTAMQTLSGGNQQKMVLAKVLLGNPKLIVACNPTRGLDFSATEYLRQKLVESADNGTGVLLFSSDLDELFSMADRILVIFHGSIMGELDTKTADLEALGMMIAGYKQTERSNA